MTNTFQLSAQQKRVVDHRGSHLQVIACAGSGKTESISQRVAALVEEGASPESIVAFTFTERAASELKDRIYRRVESRCGEESIGLLSPMFVGTIHAYCLRLLQDHVPEYGNHDVIDSHQHAGLLSREYNRLGLKKLGDRHWAPIRDFSQTVDIISNELIAATDISDPDLRECYETYRDTLSRYRLLTFGQLVAQAIEALDGPGVYERVHAPLRYLIVDEYQDINPAQDRLISLLAIDPVELCVVGDDDQSIYQWRGADVGNMIKFKSRYQNATTIALSTNRRSRPNIVEHADRFAKSIDPRLPKNMYAGRSEEGPAVIPWSAETDEVEADLIAETINDLHTRGVAYKDIAVLFRSVRTASGPLLECLDSRNIPYQCAGRTGLFLQPHVAALSELYAYLAERDWQAERFGEVAPVDPDQLTQRLVSLAATTVHQQDIKRLIDDWKNLVSTTNRPVSLIGDYYRLLRELGVSELDPGDEIQQQTLGALARFGRVLADFESTTRRGRLVLEEDGNEIYRGGSDRGKAYYQRLHSYLQHYARDAYEDFDGEEELATDAVDILTVHQSKGLEWPVVFMPSLTNGRFPSRRAGQEQDWLLGEQEFPRRVRSRYEGSDAEERRLFYVALTRARDVAYCSTFERKVRSFVISPYLQELSDGNVPTLDILPIPEDLDSRDKQDDTVAVSFSDLALYEECGLRYRMKQRLGFPGEVATELGYGRAIHHILRRIAEHARTTGLPPTDDQIESMLKQEFYLPYSNRPTFEQMLKSARRLIDRYVQEHGDDLQRIWATERPFELQIEGGLLNGRADVILNHEDGNENSLAIVDYKTASDEHADELFRFQLAVYAAAGRAEGLTVEAAYLHALKAGQREEVDISLSVTDGAVQRLGGLVAGIKQGTFVPKPEPDRCRRCELRRICKHAACNHLDLQ